VAVAPVESLVPVPGPEVAAVGLVAGTVASEVECQVRVGCAAADQDAPGRRRLERAGGELDLAGEEGALTAVAGAVAAPESDGDVAALGEVEQAREPGVPPDGEVAADEADGGARSGPTVGRVRRSAVAGGDDARGTGPDGAEASVATCSGGTPRAVNDAAISRRNAAGPQR
jgi:hypothetical protein